MKKSQFAEKQIAFALKQADLGAPVEKIVRTLGRKPRFLPAAL